MQAIVTLTMNPAVEMFLEVSHLSADRKIRCLQPIYRAGGGGIVVSRAIRSLGGQSTALFPAGGATGDTLITLLARASIATNCIRISETTRENVTITDRQNGRSYRFVVPGPDIGHDEWEHCLRALRSLCPVPDYVVASGSLPPGVPVDFYGRVAAIAEKKGFRLIVDAAGEPLREAARRGTYLLKPSAQELADMTAGGSLSRQFLEGAARTIIGGRGVAVVVVSAGPEGAILVDSAGARSISAPAVHVVSRSGAGDSLVAGMTLALSRGLSIDDAVRFGVAAGAAAVASGPYDLCSQSVTEALFGAMNDCSCTTSATEAS